jgi:hypothetical protein
MTRARATVAYPFRFQSAHGRSVRRLFEGLKRQNRPLELIYSENDAGVDEYRVFFGSAAPSVFPNVRLTMIPHCDHNLSSDRAQVIYRDAVARIARGVSETDRAASTEA